MMVVIKSKLPTLPAKRRRKGRKEEGIQREGEREEGREGENEGK